MRPAPACCAWLAAMLVLATPSAAENFRIETKVYAGKAKTPVSENVTLFQAGYVYDYLSGPERVAVFDQPHGRFILLDPERKLKAEVKTEKVLEFASRLKDLVGKNSTPFMKFAAEPEFETGFSEDGELTLESKFITYHMKTEPAQTPDAADQYRDFSDWYARFNAMTNPGSTPPFPRLAANEELAQRGLVPTEVQLTINAQPSLTARPVAMRSEHHYSWRLLQRDIERIAETANQLATFKTVELSELQPKSTARR
jgi:hypothetical protein